MKPMLMIVAACAALLFALPAEAAVTVDEQPQAMKAAPLTVQQAVTYRQGTRRLRLWERIRARIRSNRVIRRTRVATVEQVVTPVSLGVECSGCER